MTWTDEQRDAIEFQGADVLVAAAAGAGKTGVLTERVVRMVADGGCSITELLVVTFTDAAATEMRERIGVKLRAAAESAAAGDDAPRVRRLARQVVLLDAAAVCTLHSFCGQLLREHFGRLGLDPAFEILDEEQAALVRAETLDEVLEGYYNADGDERERFEELLRCCQHGRSDQPVRQLLLRLSAKTESLIDPADWWRRAVESLGQGAAGSGAMADGPWAGPLRRLFELELESVDARLAQARAAASADDAGGLAKYLDPIAQLTDYLARLRRCLAAPADTMAALDAALADYPIKKLVAVKNDVPGKERLKGLLDAVKADLAKLKAVTVRGPAGLAADLGRLTPLAELLARLVRDYHDAYARAKRDRGQLDFADLERLALKLLAEHPAVRQAIAERFRQVLVDEYQDINPVQDAILRAVASGPGADPCRLFMVGDLKQSIYRFRLAEPNIFAAACEAFEAGRGGRLIRLVKNFRSRRSVIEAANALFTALMRPVETLLDAPAGPAYDAAAQLRFAAPAYGRDDCPPDSPVELHLLDSVVDDEPEADAQDGDEAAAESEAELATRHSVQGRLIGRRIRELLGWAGQPAAEVWDERAERFRPARPRDVVILLRTVANVADRLAEELVALGLPVHATLPGGYFQAVEVSDLRSLLTVLDNPRQDIPLAAVLRSPLVTAFAGGALSADELAAVRLARDDGQFYDAVLAAREAGSLPPALRDRLSRFCEQLARWRTMSRRGTLSELLADVFAVTGCLDYVAGLRGGPQRRANLLHLARRARQFDAFARQGLGRFMRFLDELERAGEELGTPSALSEADDVVRIMSVHRAKGLQFPIVILADLEHRFNLADAAGDVLFHRELLLGLRRLDEPRRLRYGSLPHQLIARQLNIETRLEEIRLLYVATTRPRDRLILFASVPDPLGAVRGRWAGPIDSGDLLAARSAIDWLGPAVLAGGGDGPGSIRAAALTADERSAGPLAGRAGPFAVRVYGGRCLRELAGEGEADRPARPAWLATAAAGGELPPAGDDELGPADGAIRDALAERLAFRYPRQALTAEPAKRSVSELKHLYETRAEADERMAVEEAVAPSVGRVALHPAASAAGSIEEESDAPPWERAERDDARSRGLATHAVLQRLDLSAALDDAACVAERIAALAGGGLLGAFDPAQVDAEAIAAFFAGEVGRLMRRPGACVRREWVFSLGVDADELIGGAAALARGGSTELAEVSRLNGVPGAPPFNPQSEIRNPKSELGKDFVLVQGIIDALIDLDDASLMVLDFKTDAVRTERQVRERAEGYRGQLAWYARAAETILARPVSRRAVYFLAPRRLVELA